MWIMGYLSSSLNLLRYVLLLVAVSSLAGCSLDSIVNVDDPEAGSELVDDVVQSRAGGIGMYYSAIGQLARAVSGLSQDVAELTDELTRRNGSVEVNTDARTESVDKWGRKGLFGKSYFAQLQAARVRAAQARSVLRENADSSVHSIIAGTYAIEGYSLVLLAENFCSGIPISDAPFGDDISYGTGLSSAKIFQLAINKFDSALAISHDNMKIVTLARIGKGRAYLDMGEYLLAAAAVDSVQSHDIFTLTYTVNNAPGVAFAEHYFWTDTIQLARSPANDLQIVNREGNNGIVWYTDPANVDPRVPVTDTVVNSVRQFTPVVRQKKFLGGGVTFSLARWTEAMMIKAESYLQDGDARWLDMVNETRHSVGLNDTTDPGSFDQRVNLLFRERAYWFYLEGQRLADYRRLVRQYGRNPYLVYPTGPYTKAPSGFLLYGDAFVFSPPPDEYENNYRYQGCITTQP